MDGTSFPLLTAIVALPALGALVVALIPSRRPELTRVVGPLFSIATAGLTVYLLVAYKVGSPLDNTLMSRHEWIKEWGISWFLGVDGISVFLIVLTGVLFPLAFWGADPHHDRKSYTAWMLLLEAGVLGTFMSLDLFLFFVFFEIVLVPMYFLIGGWGYDQRIYAALKFFLFTMAGSAFMFVGIIATVFLARPSAGFLTFDLTIIAEHATFATSTARWL